MKLIAFLLALSCTCFTTAFSQSVGIGTSSPSARLEIQNSAAGSSTPTLRVYQSNCGGACAQPEGSALQLVNSNSSGVNSGSRISFADPINVSNNDDGAASIQLVSRNSILGFGGLSFSTSNSAGLSEKVRIDTSGYVGIGTICF